MVSSSILQALSHFTNVLRQQQRRLFSRRRGETQSTQISALQRKMPRS
jgi:hypothetical protein